MEFLPGGALVSTGEYEQRGAPHRWVAAGRYRFLNEGHPGLLHYERVAVGSRAAANQWAGMWQLDGKREKLTLTKDTLSTVLTRQDVAVSPSQAELVGLWRRVGDLPDGHGEMGVVFTPGGIEVVVGKDTPWDAETPGECPFWLCLGMRYEVIDEHTLVETDLGEGPERSRTRTFAVGDGQLVLSQEGREDLVYERVQGGLAFDGSRLDLTAWEALQ